MFEALRQEIAASNVAFVNELEKISSRVAVMFWQPDSDSEVGGWREISSTTAKVVVALATSYQRKGKVSKLNNQSRIHFLPRYRNWTSPFNQE